MYVKRIHIVNYGPIHNLDISFPLDAERPKPVLLVGENGSGKSILLSHIVNGMIAAKGAGYPESTEVDEAKVFKLRSNSYISVGAEYYFARIDFESGIFVREMRLSAPKSSYSEPPMGTDGPGAEAWESKFSQDGLDHFESTFDATLTRPRPPYPRSSPQTVSCTFRPIVWRNRLG